MWTLIFSTHIDVAVFQLFCHRKVMTKFVFLSNSRAARKADNFRRRRMCVHVLLALMINSFCLYFRNQYFANLISCFTQRTDTNDGTFSSMRKQSFIFYEIQFLLFLFFIYSSVLHDNIFLFLPYISITSTANVYCNDKIDDDK